MGVEPLTATPQEKKPVLKVCFISPLGYGLYNPGSGMPFGGAEVQFYLLAQALADDPSYAVSVLTTVGENPGVEACGKLKVFKRLGQRRSEPKWQRGILNRARQVWSYLEAFREMRQQFIEINADVYVHAGAGVEVGAYGLICRLLRRRFLFFIASSADLWEPYGMVEGPLKWLFPLGLRLAHGVVCRSSEQQQRLFERCGRAGVLLRTGHPLPGTGQIRKSTILWAGRGVPLKQPGMFLDLAERMPSQECVMAIAADTVHRDLLQQIKDRAKILRNVVLFENVPLNQMDHHFSRACVLVNTSTYEGFPNTFVQAALHRTPVVSWRVDPDHLLSSERIGLCAGESFDRLVEMVRDLCSSRERREALGQQAYDYARAHHDLSQSVATLKPLLRSLVGQEPLSCG